MLAFLFLQQEIGEGGRLTPSFWGQEQSQSVWVICLSPLVYTSVSDCYRLLFESDSNPTHGLALDNWPTETTRTWTFGTCNSKSNLSQCAAWFHASPNDTTWYDHQPAPNTLSQPKSPLPSWLRLSKFSGIGKWKVNQELTKRTHSVSRYVGTWSVNSQ